MKKSVLFGLASVSILAAGLLVGCGGQPAASASSAPATTEPAATSEPAPGTSEPAPGTSEPAPESSEIAEPETYADFLGMTSEELEKAILGEYDALYQAGAAITDVAKTDERYKAFALAEYNLIYESSVIIPWYTKNGYYATVSKLVPYQSARATYGLSADRLKNFMVSKAPISQEQRAAIKADWEAKKALPVEHEIDADGFTSLENTAPNPKAEGGKVTIAGHEFELADKYHYSLSKDPQTLNYLNSSWTYNSYVFGNQVEGLVENDRFGNIVGAMATAYKVVDNEDGTQSWTFKIREGAKWVDNKTGEIYGDVTAQDFVDGARWVLTGENASATASILVGAINNGLEYYNGEIDDFSKVGVKANEDGTLTYTLYEVTPYFLSMLTYAPFLPVKGAYMAEKGTDFGNTVNDILVNGPYTVSSYEAGDSINFKKNANYWDADHVYVENIPSRISRGTDTITTGRQLFEAGELDGFTVQAKDEEGWARYVAGPEGKGTVQAPADPNCNAVLSIGDATYIGYFNFNRYTFETHETENIRDEASKNATAHALANKDFRQGFLYGLDPLQYLRLTAANPVERLMRGYTNRELVSWNGKDYADYVDEVFNEKQGTEGVTLTGINNGSDPVFNIEKAVAKFRAAKAALIASGELTEADFPIQIDVINDMDVETAAYSQAMYEQMNEEAGDIIKIVFNTPATEDEDTQWGSVVNNYDFSMWSGWGPDYADPNTFLHTMCIGGDMVEYLGFGD